MHLLAAQRVPAHPLHIIITARRRGQWGNSEDKVSSAALAPLCLLSKHKLTQNINEKHMMECTKQQCFKIKTHHNTIFAEKYAY
jgi:hypothetical protein